ncbi:MAG: hypothetical protein NVSMB25_20120 [Thermoleophilaceae bacterium]
MHSLTTTQGIVALAACAIALVALVLAGVLAVRLRRLAEHQRAVLGGSAKRDLVEHAERLERAFADLHQWVEESMENLDGRMASAEGRVDGCLAYRALVRYDAYNELSGHQSSSLALLDARRSGVVISSIVHRDQARLYVKQLHDGEPELELSPEEQAAVDAALSPARA